jgi:hypothetical protein
MIVYEYYTNSSISIVLNQCQGQFFVERDSLSLVSGHMRVVMGLIKYGQNRLRGIVLVLEVKRSEP